MNPFNIDYTNLQACIDFATAYYRRHGLQQVVLKYPERPNYNIGFASKPRPDSVTIVFDTRTLNN